MAEDQEKAPGGAAKGGGKRKLVIGAALMALCAAAAFAAVSMGLVPGLGGSKAAEGGEVHEASPDGHDGKASQAHAEAASGGEGGGHGASGVAFVAVDPLTVTLGAGAERSHLRFTSQLEVPAAEAGAVAALMPRIVDVLGSYLRALEPAMVEDRDAHLRLRAQMLRRVRLVAGVDAVDDLLVTEFVIN